MPKKKKKDEWSVAYFDAVTVYGNEENTTKLIQELFIALNKELNNELMSVILTSNSMKLTLKPKQIWIHIGSRITMDWQIENYKLGERVQEIIEDIFKGCPPGTYVKN